MPNLPFIYMWIGEVPPAWGQGGELIYPLAVQDPEDLWPLSLHAWCFWAEADGFGVRREQEGLSQEYNALQLLDLKGWVFFY